MAWHLRFRRSVRLFPGVRFNLNRRSQSLTFKEGPVSRTVNTDGSETTNVHVAKGASMRKTTRRR